jgi:hypothetical protein
MCCPASSGGASFSDIGRQYAQIARTQFGAELKDLHSSAETFVPKQLERLCIYLGTGCGG